MFELSFISRMGVIIGMGVGVIVFLRFIYLSLLNYNKKKWRDQQKASVFRITVDKENERGPLAMEQIYSAMHGLLEKISFREKWRGCVQEQISFEIAHIDSKIQFYIWVPSRYKNFVEGQLYAQYPEIEIDEIPDYVSDEALKQKKEGQADYNLPISREIALSTKLRTSDEMLYASAMGAEIALSEINIFPIKRYPQFEDKLARIAVDPLAGITAAMSKLNSSKDQLWMQFIICPSDDHWRKRGIKAMRVMKVLFGKYLFKHSFWLQTKASKLYTIPEWWKRMLLFPLFIVLWSYRGGGVGSVDIDGNSQQLSSEDDDEIRDEVSRNHDRETSEGATISKISLLGFHTNIRVVYLSQTASESEAEIKLKEIAGSFKQFTQPQLNGFQLRTLNSNNHVLLRRFKHRCMVDPFILNVEELATVYHFPNILVQTPNIQWVNSKKMEPPVNLPISEIVAESEFTMLGKTNYRGQRTCFGIKEDDRRRHVYIIGKTGMGKSTLLENMIYSDILAKKGLAVIDPHGDLIDAILNFTPSYRTNDIIIFDPSDRDFPIGFNMLECKRPEHRVLVASGLLGVFKKMYADSWGPRLEHILRNTLLALIEFPNSTMLGILRMLVDKSFRKKVVSKVTDSVVRSFWIDEFEKMQDRQRTEAISPIQNKVGQFLSSPIIRNIVGQTKSSFDMRFAMDKQKIVAVNLSKGKIGEDNSALLGAMLVTKFQLDAMSRADIAEKDRKDFYLYVDEFQNFATDSFATILSEARKYRLCLTMANQYIAQMPEEVSNAVFGNVGTLMTFQVGYDDADFLSKQFSEEVTFNDIVCLPKFNIYNKLMVDGMPTRVFSAATLPPPDFNIDPDVRENIIKVSREKYAVRRSTIEDKIERWANSVVLPPPPPYRKKPNYKPKPAVHNPQFRAVKSNIKTIKRK